MNEEVKAHVNALQRRAHYLKVRKLDVSPDYNGRLYDEAEYAGLIWALGELGFPAAAGSQVNNTELDEPPRRDSVQRGRPQQSTWRPGSRDFRHGRQA